MNLHELMHKYTEAFNSLPEPYQNDSCLSFEKIDGNLIARPNEDQIFALGEWEAIYDVDRQEWVLG